MNSQNRDCNCGFAFFITSHSTVLYFYMVMNGECGLQLRLVTASVSGCLLIAMPRSAS